MRQSAARPVVALAATAMALLTSIARPTRAADLERSLDGHWRDQFVVALVPVASDCSSIFTDETLVRGSVETRGSHRFAAGEVAHVDHVTVKLGGRIDVFLELTEHIFEHRTEGPFTLYDPRTCKVQLILDGAARQGLPAAEAALAAVLEIHPTRESAEASRSWNERRREPLPADYDKTVAAYESWKASQQTVGLQKRLEELTREAAQLNDEVRNEPDYLAGLAAGVQRARDHVFGSCDQLADATLYADSAHGNAAYREGYADGQRLAFDLGLMRELADCIDQVAHG